jgi:hypothetical protein
LSYPHLALSVAVQKVTTRSADDMTSLLKTGTWGCVITLLSLPYVLAGPDRGPVTGRAPSAWATSFQAGFLSQQASDYDAGGAFTVNRASLGIDITRVYDRRRTIGLSVEYGYDDYHFNSAAGDPWSEVNSVNVSLPVRWSLTDSWGLLAIPMVRSARENGADLSDSMTGGFIGGAMYRFGDYLTLGPGFGVIKQLEDDTSIFPILLVQWNITKSLKVETGRGIGASQGPGLSLNWQATDHWNLALGVRYERLRFRLAPSVLTTDFVGEEAGLPLYLGATYGVSKTSEISIYTGMRMAGTYSLEDSQGNPFTESDVENATFAGIAWKYKF